MLSQNNKYCDFEGYINFYEVGCILICEHAYHFECFLFKLGSQYWYYTDYLVNEIESNCKAFQKTLNSFSKILYRNLINRNNIESILNRYHCNIFTIVLW